ncbi:hypothetical protein [Gudongella sp. SC589]
MNKLLEYFEVESYNELLELVHSKPDDEKVIELRELLSLFNIEVGDSND